MVKRKGVLLAQAAFVGVLGASPAMAQDVPSAPQTSATSDQAAKAEQGGASGAQAAASDPQPQADIVVTGLRATLTNSANLKRTSNQIQDSIIAQDIGKLPDTNIAELLQRIPGVQISRNTRGEGNAYVVHGLKQVNTTVNGRQLFTVTNRTATLLDFSSDIISGLDVYKTAAADQIEGGLGGLINVHTARPFDFKGFHFSATAAAQYSAIKDGAAPRLSGAISDRFQTGIGEIGVLLGASYERFYSGGYQVSTNVYADTRSVFDRDGNGVRNQAADLVTIPSQIRPRYEEGNRVRSSIYGALQWAPSPDLTFHADALQTHSGGHSFTQQLSVQTDGATGSALTFGSNAAANIPTGYTLTNALVRSITGASDNPYDTTSLGAGFDYHRGPFSLAAEGAYIDSNGPFYSRSITIQTRAPTAVVNLAGKTPTVAVSGVDLTSAAAYTGAVTYSDLGQQSVGREPSARVDAKYEFANSPLSAILVGGRWAQHRAVNDVYSISQTVTLAQPIAAVTELTGNDLFDNQSTPLNQWLAIGKTFITGQDRTRYLANVSVYDQPYPPTNHYNYLETTWAGYVEGQFGFNLGVPVDGNVGVRYVSTKNHQRVYVASGTSFAPVEGEASYDNWLPAANLRFKFTPSLFLRFGYSKAITRPDFGNLSPALVLNQLTLTQPPANPNYQQLYTR